MKTKSKLFLIAFLLFPGPGTEAQLEKVILKEEIVKIPTYITGAPDINPRFYNGRITQGAQGRVYPYPMYDVLTRDLVDKEYILLTLENRYVEITVLPELGGRLYSAVDKSNNYNFFYRNRVVKSSLIGTLGAWISGGIEWNFPHHHKANSMLPANYYLQENEDGSATIWISEFDKRDRYRFTLSMTLYPDKSYLEVDINPYNPTPVVSSFLYWANPAVHVDSTYQVIFPPNVQWVVQHAKREFSEWPVSQSIYNNWDYRGKNISWWKNIPVPVSFFAWNFEADYFAGYNHGKDAGVAYVSNHHIAPGMKYFAWGNGPDGEMADLMLTDEDGPYLELMAGGFSDNQPDYSWSKPYESKFVTQYWYPIHHLRGLEYANLEGGLNILTDGRDITLKMITTSLQEGARIKLSYDEKIVYEETLTISPDRPCSLTRSLSGPVDRTRVKVILYDQSGAVLFAFQFEKYPLTERPETVSPPAPPEEIKSVEELYVEGLRLDQFYNGRIDSDPYYMEALRRDPGNSQVHTQLGILDCKGLRWESAEAHLSKAISRLANNYVHPRNAQAYYYLGVAQQELGKTKEAYDNYYNACWDAAWKSPAYYRLACIDCQQGNYTRALEHITRCLDYNRKNRMGACLMAYICRNLGQTETSIKTMATLRAEDPLDFLVINEMACALLDNKENAAADKFFSELKKLMDGKNEEYLELASFYMNYGAWDEAIDVLSRIDSKGDLQGSTYPMVYYYLGYCYGKKNESLKKNEYYAFASSQPTDLCFPYRAESYRVLKEAAEENPSGGNTMYYLGNLLFDSRPEEAIKWWEKSSHAENPNYIVYRNLAMAYSIIEKDYQKSTAMMEKALSMNSRDPRLYYEIDIIYENSKADNSKRLRLLEDHIEVVGLRTDATTRLIKVYLQEGRFDKAIEVLNEYHFFRWEGGGETREYYEDAYLLEGIKWYEQKQYHKALENFIRATEYPENLETAKPGWTDRYAQTYFYVGLAHEALNDNVAARMYFQKAVSQSATATVSLFYQGLAYRKLGKKDDSRQAWTMLQAYAQHEEKLDFFSKFAEKENPDLRASRHNYLLALAALSGGNKKQAENYFRAALDLFPYNYWAKSGLEHLMEL